ncbi:MAG: isoaspartyl peptidase/L-asparaginase [Planctomycetes bacterium]|nr:isoaspartyl peptidase/L-asparaginase [Planctomycetota bacterium]
MNNKNLDRRQFIGAAAATSLAACASTPHVFAIGNKFARKLDGPGAVASHNAHNPTPSNPKQKGYSAVTVAVERMRAGDKPVDSAVVGAHLLEDDPYETGVGLGGLPNAEGIVELDASVMDGTEHRAGAVGALQNIQNPAAVAIAVMRRTNHLLMVGAGALKFAKELGFKETDLLTPESRKVWLQWRATLSTKDNYLEDEEGGPISPAVKMPPLGTVHISCWDGKGRVGGCTTTSGLAWKIPGRVGDSPIIGAGLFSDDNAGTAGSTGRGESNILIAGAHTVVEMMRAGKSPDEACLEAAKRVADTCEPRLRRKDGTPDLNLSFYAISKDGEYGGSIIHDAPGGGDYAVCDGKGARHEKPVALFPA